LRTPLTVVCISTSFRGNAFIETCKKEGCTTILLTLEKMLEKPWCRQYLDEIFTMPSFDDWAAVRKMVSDLARTRQVLLAGSDQASQVAGRVEAGFGGGLGAGAGSIAAQL